MNLQFKPADEADIPVIYAQAKSLIDTYEDIASIDYEKVMAWVNRKISTNISAYRCVTADDEKCAYFRLLEDGELDDLYVFSAFQGKGIGSEILKKCIEDSPKTLYLYVFSDNVRAISLYERFGFTVRETVGKTRIIMVRKG